jgi:hypothetical protein
MCYRYSNLQSVIINCSYDFRVSNKSNHQSKPRLQVTKTRDNTLSLFGIIFHFHSAVGNLYAEGTPRQLATATQPQFPRTVISLSLTQRQCRFLRFPQFALLLSVTCVQFRLITVLRNCGCVAVASFLGVPSVLGLK